MAIEQLQQIDNAQPAHLLGLISHPNIDRPFLEFLLADHTDVVVSFLLGVEDLLVESVAAAVDGDGVALEKESVVDLFGEVVCVVADGDQLELPRRDPEVPLAAGVLAEDGDEAFEGAEDGSVDDDRPSETGLEVASLGIS